MTLGASEYGIVGAVVAAELGMIGWVIRNLVRAFTDELAAARLERQETTERLATVIGQATATMQMSQQTLVGFGADLGAMTQLVRDHENASLSRFRELRASVDRLNRMTADTQREKSG